MTGRLAIGAGLVLTLALGVVVTGPPAGAVQEDPFPHADHQGLFPLCTGCHEGIPTGDLEEWYPEVGSCAGCHDGVERDEVSWSGPSTRIDNVVFDHSEHATELEAEGDPVQECASCHIEPGGGRMAVAEAIQVETCWSCHAHESEEHFEADATCETCHVPLASTNFSADAIADLEQPRSHEASDFLLEAHGDMATGGSARCATCHTRDRCVACHVDTDREEISALPVAPPSMELPPMSAEYPEPSSHTPDAWQAEHGVEATFLECSACHTTDDCRTCHVASVPDLVASLPARADVVAPGVTLDDRSPDSHATMFFMQAHSMLASADPGSCATCHVERFCVECHDSEPQGGYHSPNFMVRHSADAYARNTDCVNCHEARVFCRECHTDLGLAGSRVATQGYHDASPLWLFQHGQAARQNLESCASCHRQVDCTRCHGVLGAFKVSPHSADFDAERAWARSPRTCLACHIGNPLNGGLP